jgi:hypothetical protein
MHPFQRHTKQFFGSYFRYNINIIFKTLVNIKTEISTTLRHNGKDNVTSHIGQSLLGYMFSTMDLILQPVLWNSLFRNSTLQEVNKLNTNIFVVGWKFAAFKLYGQR